MERLINGRFAVDASRLLPGAGGGLPAFAASDREGAHAPVMAVQLQPGQAPRMQAIAALLADPPEGVLLPLARGPLVGNDGAERYFIVCQAPRGEALAPSGVRLAEAELLATALRPAAAALEALRVRKLTHRAVRPGNLFRSASGSAVLGCAWVGPAMAQQPAVFEPPYVAACHPSGRGEGAIADDVYALGVTLLSLALGRVPLAGLDDDAVLLRKLEHGSFDALAGHERLSPAFADVLRGMLAEHPEHRPSPALLSAAASGARRVAGRSAQRSARPLDLFAVPVSSARTLAFAIGRQPKRGVELIRSGELDRWLRRGIGEVVLANRIQDAQRSAASAAANDAQRADAMLAMKAVAVLDPLAPLCWRGLAVWPDGMGGVLAAPGGEHPAAIEEIVLEDVAAYWAASRSRRDGAAAPLDASKLRGWLQSDAAARLLYALAPGARCRSGPLSTHWVTDGRELLAALDSLGRQDAPAAAPMDGHVQAFVAALARCDGDRELLRLVDGSRAALSPLVQLRVLALLQARLGPAALPGIAAWLARAGALTSQGWRHRGRRRVVEAKLAELIAEGRLAAMLELIENPVERARDARGAQDAELRLRQIDEEVGALRLEGSVSDDRGRRIGQEIAAAMGIVAAGTAALVAGVL